MTAPKLVWDRASAFELEPFESIQPRSTPMLVKGMLPARGLAYIAGASKAGKTFVALDIVLRLAAGAPTVLGKKARRAGCVYFAVEDSDGCRGRVQAWRRKNQRSSYMPFSLVAGELDLAQDAEVDRVIAAAQDAAQVYAEHDTHLGCIVIDTLAQASPGVQENDSEGMGRVLLRLKRLSAALDCLVIVLAHHGKGGGDLGIRGWSGQDAASDATITVERDKNDPDTRYLTLSKVKNGADGAQHAFVLEPQPLGVFDDYGDEIWSCTVAYSNAVETKVVAATSKSARTTISNQATIVLSTLGFLIDRGQTQDPPAEAEGVKPGTRVVRKADLQLESIVHGLSIEGEKPDAVRKRFGRAIEELIKKRRIRAHGDALWLL